MIKRIHVFFLITFLSLFSFELTAQSITREVLLEIPQKMISQGLLGFRYENNHVYILSESGNYIILNTADQSMKEGSVKVSGSIVDFDVYNGELIYLNDAGSLGGHIFSEWASLSFNASRIEACSAGLMLYGSGDAYYLPKSSAEVVEIKDMPFLLPVQDGFFWTMALTEKGNWRADIYDCFGNMMSPVFDFASTYQPVNLQLGPEGPDNELLISGIEENSKRFAISIGNNGRMFWKLRLPRQEAPRDFAVDALERILIIERSRSGLSLNRWKVKFPEG
ncbi:MAG: hypothetical protein GX221_05800 [Candidatus Riflebacteria bacterium]|nr:hypothetical protein [Candidatus Riflebacteria bacterium]